MVRIIDHAQRRNIILAASINTYINSAQPVSSEKLAQEFDLSSATVRNIFSELEDSGYLTHPYTSAGRIPTDKGYRYYVDFLMSQIELLNNEKKSVVSEYKNKIEHFDDILEKTSEIISTITHYAGIVSLLEWEDRFFYKGLSRMLEQPEFNDSQKIRLLIQMVEEKKRLLDVINRDFKETTKVYIGKEIGCPEINTCSLVVSRYRKGKKQNGRLAVLGPRRMNYDHIIASLSFISEVVSDILEDT
ncbi:MAG: DeoR family transcriptional regulator [Candidatus Omnitrophica bacterium]|nr:DeoR family transcriptional regulator [Candidatus Omnitrophota bacterium]MBU1871962.1 DeoR family transcriptional regulator [Candidatus Omnitrophota bacterium]